MARGDLFNRAVGNGNSSTVLLNISNRHPTPPSRRRTDVFSTPDTINTHDRSDYDSSIILQTIRFIITKKKKVIPAIPVNRHYG